MQLQPFTGATAAIYGCALTSMAAVRSLRRRLAAPRRVPFLYARHVVPGHVPVPVALVPDTHFSTEAYQASRSERVG
eukprot:2769862-Rhodomonas_salina.5